MDIHVEIQKMQESRLMRTEEELQMYEDAIRKLISLEKTELIHDLCKGFDDNTEHHEVMFGLVHGIEYLYKNNSQAGLKQIANAVPETILFARDWVEILHYRILNHPEVRSLYGSVLTTIPIANRAVIVNLLQEIANEDPDMFGDSVAEVLANL